MIISFSVRNYLSFKERQSFQLIAAPIRERFDSFTENKFTVREGLDLLKSAVLYGANASGKSNFIKALSFFRQFVLTSASLSPEKEITQIPFFLNTKTRISPSEFEVTFFRDKRIYRYGFIVSRKAVIEEWLYIKDLRETMVFERKEDKIDIPEKHEILKDLRDKRMIRSNALLLSVAAQFNDEIPKTIFDWFVNMNIIQGMADLLYNEFSLNMLNDPNFRETITSLLKAADPGIEELKITETEGENIALTKKGSDISNPSVSKNKSVIRHLLSIKLVNTDKGTAETKAEYPFEIFESEGTKKFFHLSGPILDTLKNGRILIVDELDTKLHPLLTKKIVSLFNNNKTNPNNAQLIFATHDLNLLDAKIFRRDQIWFTEKLKDGSTDLFSLLDFKKGKTPRNDEKLSKNYSLGKYGAVPYLADIDMVMEEFSSYNVRKKKS